MHLNMDRAHTNEDFWLGTGKGKGNSSEDRAGPFEKDDRSGCPHTGSSSSFLHNDTPTPSIPVRQPEGHRAQSLRNREGGLGAGTSKPSIKLPRHFFPRRPRPNIFNVRPPYNSSWRDLSNEDFYPNGPGFPQIGSHEPIRPPKTRFPTFPNDVSLPTDTSRADPVLPRSFHRPLPDHRMMLNAHPDIRLMVLLLAVFLVTIVGSMSTLRGDWAITGLGVGVFVSLAFAILNEVRENISREVT